jgi:hypothetical protein
MTTASDGVAVIATQVAQTDRRALSEAWYSALHLAQGAAPQRGAATRAGAVTATSAPLARATEQRDRRPLAPAALPARSRGGAKTRAGVLPERRRPAGETALRIERAVVTLAARRPVPAAHTLDVAGGRVRLLVHGDGRTTRIVALCSRPLREAVERALAIARFTLAGAGMAVGAP